MPSYSLGIDIGGTFTDVVVYDHDTGRQWSRKVLTTHDDPVRAVVTGVEAILGDGPLEPRHFTRVVHATTLFTNALIERKGAVAGLITTAGLGDTLEIGRERKFELYDLNIAKPEPLVPRNLRLEVRERINADGTIRRPLDRDQLVAAVERLASGGVGSLAVMFLHAYANSSHEAEAVRLIAERHPEIFTTASHEVAPEIREFERASTTVANAYIKPLAHQYLGRMARQLADQGIPAPLLLMLSSGGLTHVAEAQRAPVQMLESGPAAGAIAAAFFGRADSGGDLLAFDMGGTTAKLSLVDGGEPRTAYSFEAARQKRFIEGSGLPIRISTIELIEIGAGGGSIAHVDEIGLLKVGPRSAGSRPGPRRPRRAQARHQPGDLPAVGRRRLGARPAGGAGARRSRGHRRDPSRPRRPRCARDRIPRPRGQGTRRHGRHESQARDEARPAARRRPVPGPGLRSCGRPPGRPVRRPRPPRGAPRTHSSLRGRLPREVLAHAARRAGRVHQHPRRGPRARRGKRGRLTGAFARGRAGHQGAPPGVVSRGRRLRRHDRVRPRAPRHW